MRAKASQIIVTNILMSPKNTTATYSKKKNDPRTLASYKHITDMIMN